MCTSDENVREAAKLVRSTLKSPSPLRAWLKTVATEEERVIIPGDCRFCATAQFLAWLLEKYRYKSPSAIVKYDAVVIWVGDLKRLLTAPLWVWQFEESLQRSLYCNRHGVVSPQAALEALDQICVICDFPIKE
jgi:hypothetical protein